jgi:hypothetical protein
VIHSAPPFLKLVQTEISTLWTVDLDQQKAPKILHPAAKNRRQAQPPAASRHKVIHGVEAENACIELGQVQDSESLAGSRTASVHQQVEGFLARLRKASDRALLACLLIARSTHDPGSSNAY